MARNLNWFQARALAHLGSKIRRDAWHRWIEWNVGNTFLWFSEIPATNLVQLTPYDLVPAGQISSTESLHVVRNVEFTDAEFLADDWTDEPWEVSNPCAPGYHWDDVLQACVQDDNGGGGNGGGGNGGSGGSGSGGSVGGTTSGGTGSGGAGNGGNSGGGGGNWGGGGNSGGGTGGGGSGGGSGGGGGGGGGGGNNPPKPPPAPGDYTPTVELTLVTDTDGPHCFINVPQQGTAFVNVTLPNPQNGKLRSAMISVTCLGETKLGTLGPGGTQGFGPFKGPINPGGTITATATASDGSGHSWTGTDKKSWPKLCLLPVLTWNGNQTISQRCTGSGSHGDTGYDQIDNYATSGQYAVNPDTGGSGINTGVEQNSSQNAHTTVTPYPSGSSTTTDWYAAPPGGITCELDGSGGIKNIQPKKLGILYDGPTKIETSGNCTKTTSGTESGPG